MIAADKIRDFQFVSSEKLEEIKTALLEKMTSFSAAWWRDADILKLVDVSEFYSQDGLYKEYRVFRNYRHGDEQVIFIGDESVWSELLQTLLDGESIKSGDFSSFILDRFCLEFCQTFISPEFEAEKIPADEHDDGVNRYASGCVALEFDVDGIPISILLSRGMWQGVLIPHQPPVSRGLPDTLSTLGSSKTVLNAYFQSNSIDCGTLMGLEEGAFIPLGQDFTGRVSISCGEEVLLLSGVLGKSDGGRVVKIQKSE
ncbi:hypothetical protein [Microbulbifer sp. SAOS-129_SWC]|uniref:hypothetical protein n=1 Tax=Microbulbifer sp. SAOS-129_SWC TaxID=3145235 RepID=UPI0032171F6D